jgi:hypothetical protein
MQAVYDRQRHTAPYVLIRATMLKSGQLLTEELWWDTLEICTRLAADEPPTGHKPEDIHETEWCVKSRREWKEMLADAARIEPNGVQRLN